VAAVARAFLIIHVSLAFIQEGGEGVDAGPFPARGARADHPNPARHAWSGLQVTLDHGAAAPYELFPYASLETPDGGYFVGLDMKSALHPQTLLCYEMNGTPLTIDHGAPLRLVHPRQVWDQEHQTHRHHSLWPPAPGRLLGPARL